VGATGPAALSAAANDVPDKVEYCSIEADPALRADDAPLPLVAQR
jgi:hypothetical protein